MWAGDLMDQEAAGRAKIILVVDVDENRREYASKILSGAGYRVLALTSAEEAEALAG